MRLTTFFRYLRPKYLFRAHRGVCNLCGNRTLFVLNDTNETVRNHAPCVRCGSVSRHRHLALWIANTFRKRGIGRLSDFSAHPELAVFNTSAKGSIHRALGSGPNIACSEYFDGVAPGGYKGGVLNQDLQSLTFADASFDLVISEDVFEHVPDFRKGFAEVHRVLKRGGAHIFTIPYYPDRKTRDLFRMVDGKPVLFEPIEYHGDPLRGQIPCFTHFGYDVIGFLEDLGFETRLEWAWYAEQARHGTFDCYTFIAVKR
jgi:SAM-dependent methyltransferase